MSRVRIALGMITCVLLAAGAFQAAAIDRIPVTAAFRCSAVFPQLTSNPCGTGDRLAGDGRLYVGVPLGKRTEPEGAYIGDGSLWLVSQGDRPVFFDFTQSLLAPPPPVIRKFDTTWTSASQPNWLATPRGVTNGLWGMRVAQGPIPGSLKANFRRSGDTYLWTVRFNSVNYPPSTDVTFTCTGEWPDGCNAWHIEAGSESIALLQATTMTGRGATYDQGLYRMPFAIDITYP